MPTLNPFSDGDVTLDGYTAGAFKDTLGFSGHQPFPVFQNWDATAALPNGMGSNGAYVRFAWTHGGYLYLWVYSITTSESGIYRRSLQGTPPTHTTPDAFISVATLFGSAARAWGGIYDDTNGLIYLTRYDPSTGLTGVIGCWDMNNWPFSSGNAEWISMDTTVGSRVAGKIALRPHDQQLSANGSKLFVTASYSGSVFVLDTSDGSLDGEWAYNTAYSYKYQFALVGHDNTNGYPVGGAYTATAGNGAICTWDPSTPTAWSKVATVVEAGPYGVHRNALHGHTYNALRNQSTYWSMYMFGATPRQLELSGVSNDWIGFFMAAQYLDAWGPAFYLSKLDGTEHRRLAPDNVGSLGGITGSPPDQLSPIITNPGGVTYCIGTAQGTARQIEVAGKDNAEGCPYLQCVDHPSYRFTYTASGTIVLKRIILDQDATAKNREHSRHPGKHRFRIEKKPSGGSWGSPSDWRSGAELLKLDEAVGAKPAWPTMDDGDEFRITHEMTSGFFDNFEAVEAAAGCEKTGTTLPIDALADLGMPSEVLPLVDYDENLPNAGKTYGRPILTEARIIKPEITGAEITS